MRHFSIWGTERLHRAPAAIVLARFAKRVEEEIGITISVGLSYCKYLAKVASDLEKPRGFSVIGEAEALDFLRNKPVAMIWGSENPSTPSLKATAFAQSGNFRLWMKARS